LPDRPSTQYNLRAKRHNKELIVKTRPHLTVRGYIVRMLYKNIYWLLWYQLSYLF